MAFTEQLIASVRGDSGAEIAVLTAAACPASPQAAGPEPTGPRRPPDPDRLFDIARLNKMLGQLPVSPAALPPGCAALAPRLLQARLRTAAMNRAAMAVTAEVSRAFAGAGLRHAVLKGPFQQMAVHGDPFRRPSGDIDLFVTPRDRRRAAALLQGLDFAPMEQEQALWWVPFLGEQHFRRERDGAVVDLHHRLQQAGLPDWRGAAGVLDRAVTQAHGGDAIPVLSPADGCLLMAVTLAKALLAREPCGWAAAELAHWLARLDPADRRMLDGIAAASGQERTLALGITLARACHDHPALAGAGAAPLRGLPAGPALLRDLVFQPWQRRAEAPRRRQMLRMLTEGRPHVLAAEAARAALSLRVQAALARREQRGARTSAR
ncbi:nucleotidyltransferase family protein [Paracoccus sp. MC1854]|uniref:nucleotidyltransferase family protein n=1 Tax=Paracoccus sp. MC1854 TaxID=2760306 RepID=UPI0016027474|nr:nucleotidyltransferase family protein [Paracoccus sp. MC1854]MBB1492587.1 nucleotidyltransferase family protein [Paracoccus sp. MC1854]